jgi:hypothetical protein
VSRIRAIVVLAIATAVGQVSLSAQFTACSSGTVTCTTQGTLVGLGTASPAGQLSVAGTTVGQPGQVVITDDGNFHPTLSLYKWGGSGSFYWANRLTTSDAATDGALLFQTGSTTAIGSESYTTRMVIQNGGNVGIGTNNPNASLEVDKAVTGNLNALNLMNAAGSPYSITDSAGLSFNRTDTNHPTGQITSSNVVAEDLSGGYLAFSTRKTDALSERMRIDTNGNVGIGTQTPQHLLHVAGTIGAQEVIISSTGADYVFDSDYRLKPLSEVAEYVAANHHLPEIPSAAEVAEKGVSLGDMQAKLLAKIEELTLHMIQAEKENQDLRAALVALSEKVSQGKKKDKGK